MILQMSGFRATKAGDAYRLEQKFEEVQTYHAGCQLFAQQVDSLTASQMAPATCPTPE